MSRTPEQALLDKADQAWSAAWNRLYHSGTHLFYDSTSSYDRDARLAHLPTPDEIGRQYPNPCGWATGMEDSAISAGVMMSVICDRFEVTSDPALREPAADVFSGIQQCGGLSRAKGLVVRSVSPLDGKSYYIESSRDQYTHFAHGLWRFYRSPLADEGQRKIVARMITEVCERLESNVLPGETDYHICREDGRPGLVDKMWEVDPHEVARLPMIYAIGWDLTGDRHWWELSRRYAWRAAAGSVQVPLQMRTPYAFVQEQISLESLYVIESQDPELKAAWLKAMEFVAGRVEAISWNCLKYHPSNVEDLDMNWRHWTARNRGAEYEVPIFPDALREELTAVREPGEAALVQLMCPNRPLSEDQLDLLKLALTQVDYDKCIGYSLLYPMAAYWRGVKRGLIGLP